jgi:hypothetical protein
MTTISIDSVTEFIGQAVGSLVERLDDDVTVKEFVAELGWDLPSVPAVFADIHDSALALQESLGDLTTARLDGDDAGVVAATAAVAATFAVVVGHLRNIGTSLTNELPGTFLAETGIDAALERRMVDHVLIQAVNASQMARGVLVTLGLIEENRLDADPAKHQPAFTLREFRLDRLSKLFSEPTALLADVYGWGTPEIKAERLYRSINTLSFGVLLPAELAFPSDVLVDSMFPGLPADTYVADMLNIAATDILEVGIFPAPKASPGELQGLAARLIGAPEGNLGFGLPFGLELGIAIRAALDTGLGILFVPGATPKLLIGVEGASSVLLSGGVDVAVRRGDVEEPLRVFSFGDDLGTLDVRSYNVKLSLEAAPPDVALSAGVEGGVLTISLGEGDGFLHSVVPAGGLTLDFDLGIGWSHQRGLFITGAAGLETVLALHLTLGPVLLEAIRLAIRVDNEGLRAQAGVQMAVTLGPITGVVEGLGVESQLHFASGNLGPMDLGVKFLPPTGIGVLVDAGAVHGGGFLSFDHDAGRYSGVLELSVFTVSVKAFGLLETKFPDGGEGYSFVIVIIAEFTPIQLGFGFTLLGVGGLIGVNRSMNEQALGDAVRTGSLAHLLFPRNPVQDAPAIIHDLATVFPASRAHYIFGPMAKLGWGTPTLITADLGIVIEFPGPRLAVLGVVRMQLPSPEFALLRFQLAVLGLLDFPARTFSLDASLFDSTVAGYVVTGDMAYRLGFGGNAAFLLSVGGFNSGFQAPPAFPELRRASVDLGVSGNPSLVASGYFALTSNTAQIGAKIELRASGFGIRLDGHLGFDVLFVFSPFSFTASISAGVRVSFHGVGFGITLRGSLSGPTPWHVKGRVCVSVLWWDACLPVDVKFGRAEPAALPEMDPWEGTPPVTPPEEVDPRIEVLGLRDAVLDPRNWSGSAPPAGFSVVSLAEAATAARTPIDPLGAATLRQKVVPLRRELEKFGEYKPIAHTLFDSVVVAVNEVPEDNISFVEDKFAPAHFTEFSGAQRLSIPSYETMTAGFSVAPDRVTEGTVGSATLEYETAFITAAGERFADAPGDVKFKLTHEQLLAQLERSASALGGIRRAGTQRFMLPLDRAKKVVLGVETFVVADSCSHVKHGATGTYTSRSQALLALRAHERSNPTDVNRFSIIPELAVRAA